MENQIVTSEQFNHQIYVGDKFIVNISETETDIMEVEQTNLLANGNPSKRMSGKYCVVRSTTTAKLYRVSNRALPHERKIGACSNLKKNSILKTELIK